MLRAHVGSASELSHVYLEENFNVQLEDNLKKK